MYRVELAGSICIFFYDESPIGTLPMIACITPFGTLPISIASDYSRCTFIHAVAFVFFLFTAIHAAIHHHFGMAWMITICNMVYNVFSLLLQQYNKIRLAKLAHGGLVS